MEESLSMREGSRGTVAWIQQKASIASVFTPDLFYRNFVNFILIIIMRGSKTLCRRYSVWGPQGTVSPLLARTYSPEEAPSPF